MVNRELKDKLYKLSFNELCILCYDFEELLPVYRGLNSHSNKRERNELAELIINHLERTNSQDFQRILLKTISVKKCWFTSTQGYIFGITGTSVFIWIIGILWNYLYLLSLPSDKTIVVIGIISSCLGTIIGSVTLGSLIGQGKDINNEFTQKQLVLIIVLVTQPITVLLSIICVTKYSAIVLGGTFLMAIINSVVSVFYVSVGYFLYIYLLDVFAIKR